ncbi:MAG: TRAM domain-containing protein [Candidatus Woesearchaeota archaeon]
MYQKQNRNRFNNMAPVKQGEELDVRIEALGEKGDGIAKKNGFVLVVPGTQVNDEVKVRVTKVLKKVGFAEVVGKSEKKETEETESETEEVAEEQQDSEEF